MGTFMSLFCELQFVFKHFVLCEVKCSIIYRIHENLSRKLNEIWKHTPLSRFPLRRRVTQDSQTYLTLIELVGFQGFSHKHTRLSKNFVTQLFHVWFIEVFCVVNTSRQARHKCIVMHFRNCRAGQTTIYLMESVIRPPHIHYKIEAIRPLLLVSDQYIF